MYDWGKTNIVNAIMDEQHFNNLDFACPMVLNTGELIQKFEYTENSITIKFRQKDNKPAKRFELSGSLHQHLHGGFNNLDFNHTGVFESVLSICERFHLNPFFIALENLEMGVNVKPPFNPTALIENAYCVGTSLFTDMKNKNHKKVGAECNGSALTKLYNKKLQLCPVLQLDHELMRYELKFKRMRTPQQIAGIYTMADLLNPLSYQYMANYLSLSLDKILFLNQEPTRKPFSIADQRLIENWKNPFYITNRMRDNPQMFRRERYRYFELIQNNEENESYQFKKLVRSKIIEMSQFDRMTIKKINAYSNLFDS